MCIYFYLKYWSPAILSFLTLIAIIAVPIYLLRLQKLWQLHHDKMEIFQILMAYRKNDQLYPQFLEALNVVEVVFHEHAHVVKAFHSYRDICMIPDSSSKVRAQHFVNMMSEISAVLKFGKLKEEDIHRVLSWKDISDNTSDRLSQNLGDSLR